ncbi:GNAT family N-acetyltransferase [Nanoarchaeota archaeon]
MEYQITEGSFEDLLEITKINKAVFGGTKTVEQIKEKLSLKIYQTPHITLGKINGKIIGYGLGYFEKGKQYYLWMLGVLPEFRKYGLGRKILEEQINFAKNEGYKSFLLKTSNKWKDMLRLTMKMNFDITGFKVNEWRNNPAIWLELNLN